MALPELTDLQYAVLALLISNRRSGKDLRVMLKKEEGISKSLASFYQLMSRMEESGWVKGGYTQITVNDTVCKQREYELLGSGVQAMKEKELFWARQGEKLVSQI